MNEEAITDKNCIFDSLSFVVGFFVDFKTSSWITKHPGLLSFHAKFQWVASCLVVKSYQWKSLIFSFHT